MACFCSDFVQVVCSRLEGIQQFLVYRVYGELGCTLEGAIGGWVGDQDCAVVGAWNTCVDGQGQCLC